MKSTTWNGRPPPNGTPAKGFIQTMKEQLVNMLHRRISRERAPRVVAIHSRYSIEQLPLDEVCEECGSPLDPDLRSNYAITTAAVIVKSAQPIPVLRCTGTCRSVWIPPEVSLDLLEQAVPILRRFREDAVADQLVQQEAILQETIATSPMIPPAEVTRR